uniref:Uncharacterized protein n=1 Tax=Populus trichocarpa TaxID=3694 RepID=A0A2K2ANB5_POPTR
MIDLENDLLQTGSLYFPVAVCLSFSVVLYMAGTSTYKRGLERARMKVSTFKVEVMRGIGNSTLARFS